MMREKLYTLTEAQLFHLWYEQCKGFATFNDLITTLPTVQAPVVPSAEEIRNELRLVALGRKIGSELAQMEGGTLDDMAFAISNLLRRHAPQPQSDKVREAIDDTITKAVKKFPTWPTDPLHAVAVLGEEFGELTQAVLEHTYEPEKSTIEDVRKEALHTAAMAIRFVTSLDSYEYTRGPQHSQALTALSTEDNHE